MGAGFTFDYFLRAMLVRWKFIAGSILLGILVAIALMIFLPPVYRSTATVVAGVRAPETIGPQSVAEQLSADYLLTQEDILKSERVAQQVVSDTGLAREPDAIERFQWKAEYGPLPEYIAKSIGWGLDIKSSATNSRVMEISYLSADPDFSARMANAFAKAFVDVNIDLQSDPARRNVLSYDRQLATLSSQMDTMQKELAAKQRKLSIVAGRGEPDPDAAQLVALSSAMAGAQAAAAQTQAATAGGALPDMQSSPVVQGLLAQISQQEAQLRNMATVMGPNHPDYRQLQAQIAGLRQQLVAQEGIVRQAAAVRAAQATQTQGKLQGNIASQRSRVIDTRAAQNDVSVLEQNLANLRSSYDQISQRRAQLQVLDNTAQTNITLLSSAVAIPKSVALSKTIALLACTFLGALIGVAGALAHELLDRRIRFSEQLETWLGIPDLGSIRSNDDQRLEMVRRFSGLLPRPRSLLSGPSS